MKKKPANESKPSKSTYYSSVKETSAGVHRYHVVSQGGNETARKTDCFGKED